jgi:arylsulfatase A-like enzyme
MSEKKRLWPWMLVVLSLTLCGSFLPGCSRPDRPNVLWITMDSLRADHLGCYGYDSAHTPHIDALAATGVRFEECIAQGTYTRISLPSMVTGQFPFFTGLRMQGGALDSSHTTLAEIFREHGYATFSLTNQVWSPSYGQGFQETSPRDLSTPERTDLIIEKIERYGNAPFFLWLYYWDPHAPYIPPVEYLQLYEPERTSVPQKLHRPGMTAAELDTLRRDPRYRRHMVNRYDAEIAYVDDGIGQVVDTLKRLGLFDRTIIVLNADHGESFGEHQRFGHGSTVHDEELKVPLVIKLADSQYGGRTIGGHVRNVDIMPTILDGCRLPIPQACNGRSLLPFLESDAVPELPSVTETHYQDVHLLAYRHRGDKVIYDLGRDRVQLYDLQTDPGEHTNLLSETAAIEPSGEEMTHPARQREGQLRSELLALLAVQQMSDLFMTEKDIKEIDADTKKRLRALGYVY